MTPSGGGSPPRPGATVVVATRNQGKVDELQRLFRATGWRLVPLDEAPGGEAVRWEEDGDTYLANAVIKAHAATAGTGLPALADDSGLELIALDRWPGLRTARWLGEEATAAQLRDALSERVAELPEDERAANFVCSLVLVWPSGEGGLGQDHATGRVRGTLLPQARGSGGFGYDPIFVPEGKSRTTAEMTELEKDALSHRGLAAQRLMARLASLGQGRAAEKASQPG